MNLYSGYTNGWLTKVLGVVLTGLVLVSCTDSDGGPSDIRGTVATNEVTKGTVFVIDAAGTELSKPINIDGTFKFDVRKLTPPFMLKAVASNGTDPDLYSYAAEGVSTLNVGANITPLTSLVMYIVNSHADPATLYDSWSSSFSNITEADVINAQAIVNANLDTQYRAFSLDPITYDFIKKQFLANGFGFDALLKELRVDISTGINIFVTGIVNVLPFDSNIDVTGFDIGGTTEAVAGDYSVTRNVSIDGGGVSANILLGVNFPASSVPTVPSGNVQMVEDMFRTLYGSVGDIVINSIVVTAGTNTATTISAVVDATITTTDGPVSYVATYIYTLKS